LTARIFTFSAAMALLGFGVLLAAGAGGEPKTSETRVSLKADRDSLLRNPAMGWVLYAEDLTRFPDATSFWRKAEPSVNKASILYIRAPWSLFEPQEGAYCWEHDANFKKLVEGARERGLRLAFRVVLNSRDCSAPAAPDYVARAGAKGYLEKGTKGVKLWCPDVTDPVFRAKFGIFLRAFGRQYDDPAVVDYIDGGGLGYWGEMHHVAISPQQRPEVYDWICSTYSRCFHHVLLGAQAASELGHSGPLDLSIAMKKYGYVPRIDSLGSHWMSAGRREALASMVAFAPLFGESCYFSLRTWPEPWKQKAEGFQNPRDVLEATMKDALEFHANTLDLRAPEDARTWSEEAPDLVQRFIREGGYRLAPTSLAYELLDATPGTIRIRHTWRNFGVGFLPNDNPRWNHKYRVAFALLPIEGNEPLEVFVDSETDPGSWRGDQEFECATLARFQKARGACRLAIAIVDTSQGNTPAIALAVEGAPRKASWLPLGEVSISR
jgi:hypothetical protein